MDDRGRPIHEEVQAFYEWDESGNLTATRSSDTSTEYFFDAADYLAVQRTASGSWRHGYLPAGDRLWRAGPTGTAWFCYLDEGLVGLKDEQGVTWLVVTLPGSNWPIALCGSNGQTLLVISDRLGSIRRLANPRGQIVSSVDYGAYGKPLQENGRIMAKLEKVGGRVAAGQTVRITTSDLAPPATREPATPPRLGSATTSGEPSPIDGTTKHDLVPQLPVDLTSHLVGQNQLSRRTVKSVVQAVPQLHLSAHPVDDEIGRRTLDNLLSQLLRVLSQGSFEARVYVLKRGLVELSQVGVTILTGEQLSDRPQAKLGYVHLPTFYTNMAARRQGKTTFRGTARDLRPHLERFDREGRIDVVLLDVRNNGGGSLDEAVDTAALFVGGAPVVQSRDRIAQYAREGAELIWAGPVVVLANRVSAGGAEILAAAIQDYEHGLVVGDPSTLTRFRSARAAQRFADDPDAVGVPSVADVRLDGYLREAIAIALDYASRVRYAAGGRFYEAAEFETALQHYRSSVRTNPDYRAGNYRLAWMLATCPQRQLRNGQEALVLARRAGELANWNGWHYRLVLALAQAEAGQFEHAAASLEEALAAAPAQQRERYRHLRQRFAARRSY